MRGVDGVISHSHQLASDDPDSLIKMGTAVLTHGNGFTHPFADNVMIDEVKATEEAISYLIDQGHVRLGTIAGPEATWDGRLRKGGSVRALQAHDIPIDDDLIFEVDFFRQGVGVLAMKKFLALPEPPSAAFAASDHIAIEALLSAIAGTSKTRWPARSSGKLDAGNAP